MFFQSPAPILIAPLKTLPPNLLLRPNVVAIYPETDAHFWRAEAGATTRMRRHPGKQAMCFSVKSAKGMLACTSYYDVTRCFF